VSVDLCQSSNERRTPSCDFPVLESLFLIPDFSEHCLRASSRGFIVLFHLRETLFVTRSLMLYGVMIALSVNERGMIFQFEI
jgi:hypothetical protein